MSSPSESIDQNNIKRDIFLGRFERYLDFVMALRQLYSLPQSATAAEKRSVLASIHAKFFTCPAKERLAITSQVRFAPDLCQEKMALIVHLKYSNVNVYFILL